MRVAENWIAWQTLVRREFTRFLRIWTQTLLPSPISMTLYFVIFGALIGPRIGKFEGFDFIEYIAPGLIMMAIITNAYANVVASFFQAKFQRNIEEMYVSPMSSIVLLTGYLAGGILRGFLVAMIVTIVACFFTRLPIAHFGLAIALAFLTALLFSLAGLINAVYAQKFDDINIVPTFILTPLSYLGGVFYSVSMLPDFWRMISYFNPILYMINAFRYAMLGVSDVNISVSMIVIVLSNIILCMWAYDLLKRGVGIKS